MLIESLIRRKNGSVVTFGKAPNVRTYTFKPTSTDPRHVAEVGNDDDAQTLLGIKEGYRIAKALPAAKAAATSETKPQEPAAPPAYSVAQQGQGKNAKWFVVQDGKPVSEGFADKSAADAAMADLEKQAGE